jgi:hypothetical protein
MFVRIVLLIAALVLAGGTVSNAAEKHPAKSACTEHVKAMKAMKTADERTAYCKEHADCESNHCMSKMSSHKKSSAKKSAPSGSTTTTPK